MENSNPSTSGTFMRGFMSSAGNGALMSGIFYGLLGLGSVIFPTVLHFSLMTALPVAAVMIAAIGIFGGVSAVRRAAHGNTTTQETNVSAPSRERSMEVAIPVPVVAADRADDVSADRPWTDRVDANASHRNRITQILENGALDDKSRASAILAERQGAQQAAERG